MKTFLLFVVGGAIAAITMRGEADISAAAVCGAAGGFCFWLLIKIVGFLNRNAGWIADQADDD